MRHLGEVSGEVDDALNDGEITDRHMEKIEPKFRKALTAMVGWLARIKGRMKRDASKPRRPFFKKAVDDSTPLHAEH